MEATRYQDLELTSVFKDDRAGAEDHPMIGEHPLKFKTCQNYETPETLREVYMTEKFWVLSYCRFNGVQLIRYICAEGIDHVELSEVDSIEEDNWEDDPDISGGHRIKDEAYYLR